MKKICIYTNIHKDGQLATTHRIEALLKKAGMPCLIKTDAATPIPLDVDCILVLGGDGTMLQAAREVMERKGVALLGVNLGTLGYLTEVEPDKLEEAVFQLQSGNYELENRMMLNGIIRHGDGTRSEGWSLNDIVIGRSGAQQVLQFYVYVNGRLLNHYAADGMIVTTPTGSTGYNLSAGGPIAEPGARLLILTPICPHTMIQRSVILSPEDEVVITLPEGREGEPQRAAAYFDGCPMPLETGESIRIVKSEKTTDFIKLGSDGFLDVLRKKMTEN